MADSRVRVVTRLLGNIIIPVSCIKQGFLLYSIQTEILRALWTDVNELPDGIQIMLQQPNLRFLAGYHIMS